MLEEQIIECGAPVLAALKTAALFNYRFESREQEQEQTAEVNRLLNAKDLYLRVLRQQKGMSQLYLYRKSRLAQDLGKKGVRDFLEQYGYRGDSQEADLAHLEKRLKETGEFPHEIGLFLGYPLADVIGFIENRGRNYQCMGWWKVYHDEQETRKSFERYEKCAEIYQRDYRKGRTLLQLTVAV
jgi:hypothetical protein